MLRSDVKAALGKEHESIEDARRALRLNPVDPLVAKGLARALYARNRKLDATVSGEQRQEMRQALEQALRLDPRDASLLSVYIDVLGDSDPEKAVALRQTIQANTPNVDNALKLGRLAAQIALAAKDPARQKAFFTMAQTAFDQARELDPNNRVVLEATMLMEALVAAGQGRYAEAIESVDKCIQSAGPDTDAGLDYTARKAQLLTLAYNRTSDKTYLQRAIGVYESLRAKWPKNSSVLNNLAYLLAQNDERLAEALEYAQTVVEQDPDEANYLDTYGYVLYKNGKHAEAARSLAAAVQKYEGDPNRDPSRPGTPVRGTVPTDVYEHLGMVHEALGDRGQALDAYRRAWEAGGTALSEAAKQRIDAALKRLQ
jgi:tetratricopeptide (TPR) repeat protein